MRSEIITTVSPLRLWWRRTSRRLAKAAHRAYCRDLCAHWATGQILNTPMGPRCCLCGAQFRDWVEAGAVRVDQRQLTGRLGRFVDSAISVALRRKVYSWTGKPKPFPTHTLQRLRGWEGKPTPGRFGRIRKGGQRTGKGMSNP
jgi:hypothetical protein